VNAEYLALLHDYIKGQSIGRIGYLDYIQIDLGFVSSVVKNHRHQLQKTIVRFCICSQQTSKITPRTLCFSVVNIYFFTHTKEDSEMAARRKAAARSTPANPQKPWGTKTSELPKYVLDSLYQVYHFLGKETRQRVGLMMKIPVFIQDPLVAQENPTLGVQEIEVRLEAGMADGPTSSRIAVVDFNADTQRDPTGRLEPGGGLVSQSADRRQGMVDARRR
jgi:hypothetical protein